ncbi:phosphopyruvate hydratase [bacterium]|nr:MAG: phosphopyruvate hydratase [bacterium]
MKIKDIEVKEILDSRGEPTIEVNVTGEDGKSASAQIPSGKSRGKNEAVVLKPAEAKHVLEKIVKPNIADRNFESIGELDAFLITLDGTDNKEKLGGNLILGISIAFARLTARAQKKELWQVLNEEFFGGEINQTKPLIFSNLINGGAHAKNNLDIQEYMVVVKTHSSYKESIRDLKDFYGKLGDILKNKFRLGRLMLGDEGGYSLEFTNNFEPIEVLAEAIKENDFRKIFSIALDCAADTFYEAGIYNFGGHRMTTAEMVKIYRGYFEVTPLLMSIEDPFAEDDHWGFKELKAILKDKLMVGDDLTTTNPITINEDSKRKLINGVIIKPNQIGTVTETCEAIKTAHVNGLKTILSHRSGEVEDPFVIHFAKAGGAYGVKIGAPVESRMSMFYELERLYG